MKYTLAQNAISSFGIAIENFKKFYYLADGYSQSQIDEAIKICIVFMENSVELMLKDILVSVDPLSIYEQPNSEAIRNALTRVTDSCKLEDILISEGNFKTIKYTDAVNSYNRIFHNSDKLYNVLKVLGEKRNAITHFGFDGTAISDEIIISLLNVFDIIYNYLYPQLIKRNDISEYFVSDSIVVNTTHGKNLLFDEDTFIYNNIIDFLDELMETSKDYVCAMRALNPQSKIYEFTEIFNVLVGDGKFSLMLDRNHAQIEFSTYDITHNSFRFDVIKDIELLDSIGSCYSPYFNVTAFCGEAGNIYFLVAHDKHKLYIYDQNKISMWPQSDEVEPDSQWITDNMNGICQEVNLSKRNLLRAFENILN